VAIVDRSLEKGEEEGFEEGTANTDQLGWRENKTNGGTLSRLTTKMGINLKRKR